MQLVQRTPLSKERFSIAADGIEVSRNGLMGGTQFIVPYTSIPSCPIHLTTSPKWTFSLSAVLLTLTGIFWGFWIAGPEHHYGLTTWAILILCACATLTFVMLFFILRNRRIIFTNGEDVLTFKENTPSTQTVSAFIDEIQSSKRSFFERRIRRFSESDPSFNARTIINELLYARLLSEDETDKLEKALKLTSDEEDFGFRPD